jgi:hypothetical protein
MTPQERVEQVKAMLDATTTMYRPDESGVEEDVPTVGRVAVSKNAAGSTDVWVNTPTESELRESDRIEVVDVHFFKVAVDKAEAEDWRDIFNDVCLHWPPDPTYQPENRLAGGPSYIELGGQIGTFMGQQDAMRFMALGKVLGAWDVITPRSLFAALHTEIEDAQANAMAGSGYVMISGWKGMVPRP